MLIHRQRERIDPIAGDGPDSRPNLDDLHSPTLLRGDCGQPVHDHQSDREGENHGAERRGAMRPEPMKHVLILA